MKAYRSERRNWNSSKLWLSRVIWVCVHVSHVLKARLMLCKPHFPVNTCMVNIYTLHLSFFFQRSSDAQDTDSIFMQVLSDGVSAATCQWSPDSQQSGGIMSREACHNCTAFYFLNTSEVKESVCKRRTYRNRERIVKRGQKRDSGADVGTANTLAFKPQISEKLPDTEKEDN